MFVLDINCRRCGVVEGDDTRLAFLVVLDTDNDTAFVVPNSIQQLVLCVTCPRCLRDEYQDVDMEELREPLADLLQDIGVYTESGSIMVPCTACGHVMREGVELELGLVVLAEQHRVGWGAACEQCDHVSPRWNEGELFADVLRAVGILKPEELAYENYPERPEETSQSEHDELSVSAMLRHCEYCRRSCRLGVKRAQFRVASHRRPPDAPYEVEFYCTHCGCYQRQTVLDVIFFDFYRMLGFAVVPEDAELLRPPESSEE